jgi:hypothetical protein
MKVPIPAECAERSRNKKIVCAENWRKITFLNQARREVVKYSIDGCSRLRPLLEDSPVKYPACMRLGAEPRVSRMAEWQILATRGDSRSVVDRAGAVSGLNLNRSSAGWLMNC